jgi:hypothetical protein
MTATEVLERVKAAGGVVVMDPQGARLRVPKALRPLVEEHREAIKRHLAEAQESARAAMSSLTREVLARFTAEGDAVGFRVPWCDRVLWWAPSATEAAKLVAWGVASPGAVWTATELDTLIGLAGSEARAVVLAKLAVDGVIEATRRR